MAQPVVIPRSLAFDALRSGQYRVVDVEVDSLTLQRNTDDVKIYLSINSDDHIWDATCGEEEN